jgi:polysaccharide biosynthesis protein PslH
VFQQQGIHLDVVGDVPEELLETLRAKTRATTFHGFVDSMEPLLDQARVAVVPELIGGGFKLKFLDYFFGRVPVATLGAATAGLPAPLRPLLIAADTLEGLVDDIVQNIDRLDRLNELQDKAFHVARTLFRWEDRGVRLKSVISHLQLQWQQARLISDGDTKNYATRST